MQCCGHGPAVSILDLTMLHRAGAMGMVSLHQGFFTVRYRAAVTVATAGYGNGTER
jgi:hypothetical protein